MNVLIEEASSSLAVSYQIIGSDFHWIATKQLLALHTQIEVRDAGNSVLGTIAGESLIFNRFTIRLRSSGSYHYRVESGWKGVDVCEGPEGSYRVYRHHKRRYSLFREEDQIAVFESEKKIIGNGRIFHLRVEPTVNITLVVAIVLCINTSNGADRQENSVTWDFGNFGPEAREFDETWRASDEPKELS